ncbi:MAG TPA: flavodoxin domain-containing protein [Anaerohalosphaeraceae bacterium]|nr:NAD(P)H-dependent oxidoreductase [Phycisphaerae bacterium]HOK95115.1 flavodoxin domain-containing protein [Anaerohalosphaeraceae bacterium]HOL31045.1 flavodoxin domain-containing protein [Anaerohalosphaeraceae bacterium]HOM75887.1 flavodoxin domain-containing protein [Anaerohalosphaeraceae bacterium]HPC64138.1 flavodoxin domain-containing protein [Anaerohalosphaeraceae bacterium]
MAKGLVLYYSRSGNTKMMANAIAEAMEKAGLPTKCKSVTDAKVSDLVDADAVVVGSPTYYGRAAAAVAQLFDESVSKHGKLDGKVGAAFSSSANIGGGNETTICEIINMMLIHGMIVQGDPQGDHYGPVSIGKPDERVLTQCARRGQRVAALTLKLFG